MRTILTLLACLVVAPMTAGCHRSGEICDIICDCEKCSDRGYDECIIRFDATEDIATAHGCSDQFNRAYDCVSAHSTNCKAGDFAPDATCKEDIDGIDQCIASNSAL